MIGIGLGYIGVGLAAGLGVIGAGLGIGWLANGALSGAARQPEAIGPLQTMMIIPAAMIEGVALLALVIAFLVGAVILKQGVPSAGQAQAVAAQEAQAK